VGLFRPSSDRCGQYEQFGKAPTWGAAWKSFIKQNADRWNTAYLQKTTLPYEDNYLDLDPTERDALGFPVIRITADNKDNEKRIGAFIQDKMAQWFFGSRRDRHRKRPARHDGPLDPRLWRHPHGRTIARPTWSTASASLA